MWLTEHKLESGDRCSSHWKEKDKGEVEEYKSCQSCRGLLPRIALTRGNWLLSQSNLRKI